MKILYCKNLIYIVFFVFYNFTNVHAQIISTNIKIDKQPMFNVTANYPFFFNKNKPYELMLGFDYTTKNAESPSGFAPQATFGYFIVDNKHKDYLLFAGLTTGYLFDFNKHFENQLRITPHLYFEYLGLFNIKAGYDYQMDLQKSHPFISIGFGGLLMFRNFKVM